MRALIVFLCVSVLLAACAPQAAPPPSPTPDLLAEAPLDTRCDNLSFLEAATDDARAAGGLSISLGAPALPALADDDCEALPLGDLIPAPPDKSCYLRIDGLLQAPPLFAGPELIGEPIAALPQGEWLPVVAISTDEHYQVQLEDGTLGWVAGSTVRLYGTVQGLCEGLPQSQE